VKEEETERRVNLFLVSLCTLQVLPIFVTLDETKKSKHEKTPLFFVYPASFILQQQQGGWMKGMTGWMDTSKWEEGEAHLRESERERVLFGLIW
jgi:hypothetical protein